MKHLLLSVIMLMTAVTISAQDYQYKLVRYYDNTNTEMEEFIYNEQHVLIAIHRVVSGMDGYECYDSIRYDENGDLVRLETWQLFYDNEFEPYLLFVNYAAYTYDAQHRLLTRKNYNLDQSTGGFALGGTYTYTYDEDGNRTKSELNFAGRLFETIDYTYANGHLTQKLYKADYEGTGLEITQKQNFWYDEDYMLETIVDSTYDGTGYEAYLCDSLFYDASGNCTKHNVYNKSGNETERHVYTYCNKLKAETLMPFTPEMEMYDNRPKDTRTNLNVYTSEEYWTLDINDHLQHICDYTYEYIGINESGVEDVKDDVVREVRKVRKVMVDGRLYIECGEKVYDMNGRRVK